MLWFVLFAHSLQAQETNTYQQQIRHVYAELDKSTLKTGLFADMAFPFKDLKLFNGSKKQERPLKSQDYEMAYHAVYTMQQNAGTTALPKLNQLDNIEKSENADNNV